MTTPDLLGITSQAPVKPRMVLIVDDEASVVRLFSSYVRALGHVALTATSADEALSALMTPQGVTVDTVLVDIMMPGHDGAWLIDQLGARYPWLRVVIATGLAELDAGVSLRPNVIGYLVKPFGVDDLRPMLEGDAGDAV